MSESVPYIPGPVAEQVTTPPPAGGSLQAAWMQHWISAHVAQGWQLEGVHANIAVMIGGAGTLRRIHLIVDEAGALSYGGGHIPTEILAVPRAHWYDDRTWHWVVAIGFLVAVFAVIYIIG